MANSTINISIDYLKIQGARKVTKEGKDYVLIDIAASRAKHFKREGKDDSVYGSFDIKNNRDGEDKFGKTHFCAESSTKEERQAKKYMPVLGNGKEFVFDGSPRQSAPKTSTPAKQHPLMQDDNGTDEIPC